MAAGPEVGERVSVVVGASGALGSAVLTRLLGDGRRVLAIARDPSRLPAHPAVTPLAADLTTDDSIETIRAALAGPVDLALFCPGLSVTGSLATVEPGALAVATNTKVGGLVRFLRALDPQLDDGSRVVAVGGSLGVEPGPLDAAPGTVNAALHNLMRQASQLLGPRGVTTVTLAPGPLDTPRLHAFAERRAAETGRDRDEVFAEYVAKTSSGRLPTADDVAWLICTLLSPHARCLHGAVLSPDGGVRRGLT